LGSSKFLRTKYIIKTAQFRKKWKQTTTQLCSSKQYYKLWYIRKNQNNFVAFNCRYIIFVIIFKFFILYWL
jgi:hypothetical protein